MKAEGQILKKLPYTKPQYNFLLITVNVGSFLLLARCWRKSIVALTIDEWFIACPGNQWLLLFPLNDLIDRYFQSGLGSDFDKKALQFPISHFLHSNCIDVLEVEKLIWRVFMQRIYAYDDDKLVMRKVGEGLKEGMDGVRKRRGGG